VSGAPLLLFFGFVRPYKGLGQKTGPSWIVWSRALRTAVDEVERANVYSAPSLPCMPLNKGKITVKVTNDYDAAVLKLFNTPKLDPLTTPLEKVRGRLSVVAAQCHRYRPKAPAHLTFDFFSIASGQRIDS
jgi:hypothetical protein